MLVGFVLATFTFSVAVTWVVGGPAGLTYWFWSRWLPDDNQGLPYLLGFPGRFADVTFNTVLGVIMLVTTPIVLRGLVACTPPWPGPCWSTRPPRCGSR